MCCHARALSAHGVGFVVPIAFQSPVPHLNALVCLFGLLSFWRDAFLLVLPKSLIAS